TVLLAPVRKVLRTALLAARVLAIAPVATVIDARLEAARFIAVVTVAEVTVSRLAADFGAPGGIGARHGACFGGLTIRGPWRIGRSRRRGLDVGALRIGALRFGAALARAGVRLRRTGRPGFYSWSFIEAQLRLCGSG